LYLNIVPAEWIDKDDIAQLVYNNAPFAVKYAQMAMSGETRVVLRLEHADTEFYRKMKRKIVCEKVIRRER
jgi:hypothetical protein